MLEDILHTDIFITALYAVAAFNGVSYNKTKKYYVRNIFHVLLRIYIIS